MRSLTRHGIVALVVLASSYMFGLARSEWHWLHKWNRAFADVSLGLLVFILVVGAVSRLWAPIRKLLPWRRELGIWVGITSALHVLLILIEWVKWDLRSLFFVFHPNLNTWIPDPRTFGIGNVIGVVALVYVVLLVATSNDFSMKRLGSAGWKFVQQRSYTLFVLTVVHAAAYVYFLMPDRPNFIRWPLALVAVLVPVIQAIAFWHTVREQSPRRPRR